MIAAKDEEDSAMVIYRIQEKWMLKVYFRRWISAADINIKYKRKPMNSRRGSLKRLETGIIFDGTAVAPE